MYTTYDHTFSNNNSNSSGALQLRREELIAIENNKYYKLRVLLIFQN